MKWSRPVLLGTLCGLLVYGQRLFFETHHPLGNKVKGTLERVIDGDTIRVNGLRIRLWAIDAPEVDQTCNGGVTPCGWISAEHLYPLTGQHVTCSVKTTDRYGRPVALCATDSGTDIAAFQVLAGQALAVRRYSDSYVLFEDAARNSRAGLWSGTFDNPSAWRHRHH